MLFYYIYPKYFILLYPVPKIGNIFNYTGQRIINGKSLGRSHSGDNSKKFSSLRLDFVKRSALGLLVEGG